MRRRGGSSMVLLAATLGALCASDEFSLPAFIQDQQRFQEPPHGQSAQLPVPQLAARAACDARLRPWAAARILVARLSCVANPSDSSQCGGCQRVPKSPPLTVQDQLQLARNAQGQRPGL